MNDQENRRLAVFHCLGGTLDLRTLGRETWLNGDGMKEP